MANFSAQTPDHPANASEKLAAFHENLPTRPIHTSLTWKKHGSTDSAPVNTDLSFLAPSEQPGSLGTIDHYEILEIRGQGGFGIVFKALDKKLQRIVALKILPPYRATSPLARKRFLREAQAGAAVHNDHVVAIFAVEDGPLTYLVMEYVDGPSLEEKIEATGPFPLEEILRIGRQTACGLAAAHEQGLIHRDIKPGNILLENGGERVKITDFGLARAVDDASLSQAGVIQGTPAFMAPEQAAGEQVDHRADLFSLGSVLYTLATGQAPFGTTSSLAVLQHVLNDSATPIRRLRPELPTWFEDLVARLHAKKPGGRYQSAQEVADLLAQHLSAVQTQGSAYRPRTSPRRRLRHWLAAALAVALVIGVVAGWRIAFPDTSSSQDRPSPQGQAASEPPAAMAPFDAPQAQLHQEAWAQYLKTPVEQVNSIGLTLRLVPPGGFSVLGEGSHFVRISKPFYAGAHEVTVAQFRKFVDATGYKTHAECDPKGGKVWNPKARRLDQRPDIHWRSPGFPQTEQHPVACMTWKDAAAFCRWLTRHERMPYRLPTEAEWEYACRAGTTTPFHYGPVADPQRMNVNLRGTTPVGSFPANAFGLCDMHGNLYEWCLDAKRSYGPEPAIDPRGPDDGPERAIRGGAYSSGLSGPPLASGGRSSSAVDHAYAGNGFRVVMEIK